MCRRFILASKPETMEKRFGVVFPVNMDWTPGFVVSPGEESLVITQQNPKTVTLSRFGMKPSWATQSMNLLNARAEGNKNPGNDPCYSGSKAIFLKKAFKRSLFTQRCIVIADAFVEWSAVTRQPFLIYLRNHEYPFGMAGLYDIWKNRETRAEFHTFTIITVPANGLVHHLPASRMPVIIPKGRETDWLRPAAPLTQILGLLEIFPAGKMNAYPVGKAIESSGPFTSGMLHPVGERVYSEADPRPLPQRRYWHKEKGAAGSTWRGNAFMSENP